jgi:eukaryotic-like serine/threonine-protein kinase
LMPAIGNFERARQKRPNHFWAWYFLAVCQLRLDQPRVAKDNLNGCLAVRKDVAGVYNLLGFAYGKLGQFSAAEDAFHDGMVLNPDDETRYALLVNRGAVRGWRREFRGAKEDLREAIKLKPEQYQAYANLARLSQQQNNLDGALAQLDDAIRVGMNLLKTGQAEARALASLHHNRAVIHWERGNLSAALADFEAALEDFEAALEDFDNAIRFAPGAEDHADRGRLLHSCGRYPEAVEAYIAALKIQRDLPDVYLVRAKAQLAQRHDREAADDLKHYLKSPPPRTSAKTLAEVHVLRGLTLARITDSLGAIDEYTLALDLRPESSTWTHKGWAHLSRNELPLAESAFQHAIDRDGDNGDAHNGRGFVRVRLGRYREALQDAAAARLCGPKDSRMLWNAAHIYAQVVGALATNPRLAASEGLGRPAEYRDEALRLLKGALRLAPPSERATFWRTYIQADPWLRPIQDNSAAYAELERFARGVP